MRSLADAQAEADIAVEPWQRLLKPGDKVVLVRRKAVLCAEILDPVVAAREDGATDEQLDYLRGIYADPQMKNYRVARCYRPMQSDGEVSDIHISSTLRTISDERFEEVRRTGWITRVVARPKPGPSTNSLRRIERPKFGNQTCVLRREDNE